MYKGFHKIMKLLHLSIETVITLTIFNICIIFTIVLCVVSIFWIFSLHNSKTIRFILELQTDGVWIGGFRQPGSSLKYGWSWVDNSAWTYTNWRSGEPNNDSKNDEFCLQQHVSGWNDVACSVRQAFVCKKPHSS